MKALNKRFTWEENEEYIKTMIDVIREPVLIIDKNFVIVAANEPFYRTFQVERKDTDGKKIYELGNGQWNIPALRKLLEDILPNNIFFKGFEVIHEFPTIGRKVMILNARQINSIILLAIEDVSDMMVVADILAGHANQREAGIVERTRKLESQIRVLEKKIRIRKDKSVRL
jgi:PAS domain-containing protein